VRVLVVGAGKVGSAVAASLVDAGHDVVVVESRPEHVEELEIRLGAARLVLGSATDPAVLESAGVRSAAAVAILTGADETNLAVASLARFEFGVKRVVARVVDPRNRWMYDSDLGVDVALDQSQMLAHLVAEEISLGDLQVMLGLRRGRFALVGEVLTESSPAVGSTLEGLRLPADATPVAVLRGGHVLAPSPDLVLRADDELLIVAADAVVPLAAQALSRDADVGLGTRRTDG
jgi:trk system potassium uptake protein TrkA